MDVLKIFYDDIIKEACNGKINCAFNYNILFNTYLAENGIYIAKNTKKTDTLVPTLIIKNKKMFDDLLLLYVDLAMNFYTTTYFDLKVLQDLYIEGKNICKEKLVLTTLWLNATSEDFNNPIQFLRKRIEFLKSEINSNELVFGYSSLLDGEIVLEIKKDDIFYESPYKIVFSLKSEDKGCYRFPCVRFGVIDDSVYIYAIQNDEEVSIPTKFTKKVKRNLYKIGEGFDSEMDNYYTFEEGNLKDVTASFLVSLNMAISYFHSLGYRKFFAPSILVPRWNSHALAINKAPLLICNKLDYIKEQEDIQRNITDKFIRTFLRLIHHYDGMEVFSYPYELDTNLIIKLNEKVNSNNKLLNETAKLARKKNS